MNAIHRPPARKHARRVGPSVARALGAIVAAVLLSAIARAASIADFADYSHRNDANQVLLPGRLFTPPEAAANPATPRPLMVYLHGGGAIGTDNVTQILQTPDYLIDEAKRRGAFLYVPQTLTGWSSLASIDSAMTMINRAVADLHADANRLYAAGYSNGGGGVWNLLSRYKNRFAAAVPVAGVVPAAGFVAANLIDTPIFAVHARDDETVTVAAHAHHRQSNARRRRRTAADLSGHFQPAVFPAVESAHPITPRSGRRRPAGQHRVSLADGRRSRPDLL